MLTLLTLLASVQDPETARVTLEARDLSLSKILEAFRTQTKVPIDLSEAAKKEIDLDQELITISVKDLVLTGALRLIFGPRDCDVTIVNQKKLLISPKK